MERIDLEANGESPSGTTQRPGGSHTVEGGTRRTVLGRLGASLLGVLRFLVFVLVSFAFLAACIHYAHLGDLLEVSTRT